MIVDIRGTSKWFVWGGGACVSASVDGEGSDVLVRFSAMRRHDVERCLVRVGLRNGADVSMDTFKIDFSDDMIHSSYQKY